MNLEALLAVLFLALAIVVFAIHVDREQHQQKTYYQCQDYKTKQMLKPVSAHKFQLLKETYEDFSKHYICKKISSSAYLIKLHKGN